MHSKFRNIEDAKTLIEYSKSISHLSTAINRLNTQEDIKIKIDFVNSAVNIKIPAPEKIKKIIKNCYISSDNKFYYIRVSPTLSSRIKDFDYDIFNSKDASIRFIVDNNLEVTVGFILPKKYLQEHLYKDKELIREAFDKVINHFTENYDISFIRQEENQLRFHVFFK